MKKTSFNLLPDVADEAQVIVWNQFVEMSSATRNSTVLQFNPKLNRLKAFLKSIKADLQADLIGLQVAYDQIRDCVTAYKSGWYC